jgi:geranylgeranyl diphosphate synthase type II
MSVRPAIWAARLIYGDIGRIVGTLGREALGRRAVTSGARKALLLGRACLEVFRHRAYSAAAPPATAGGYLFDLIDGPPAAAAAFDDAELEAALRRVVVRLAGTGCPPTLGRAITAAVFPGGQRLRPRVCRAVALAVGSPDPTLLRSASLSLELLHCASLIQDDLPIFDDAPERRGRPAVPRRFGAPVALLASDALIIEAFGVLEDAVRRDAARGALLLRILTRAVAPPHGLVAGQAWECEPAIDLPTYHRGKTAALFEAAAVAGAIVSGADGEAWRPLGHHLGMAYQVADDITDAPEDTGRRGGATNAVAAWGRGRSRAAFSRHVDRALAAVPATADRRLRVFLEGLLEGFSASADPPERGRSAMVGVG